MTIVIEHQQKELKFHEVQKIEIIFNDDHHQILMPHELFKFPILAGKQQIKQFKLFYFNRWSKLFDIKQLRATGC